MLQFIKKKKNHNSKKDAGTQNEKKNGRHVFPRNSGSRDKTWNGKRKGQRKNDKKQDRNTNLRPEQKHKAARRKTGGPRMPAQWHCVKVVWKAAKETALVPHHEKTTLETPQKGRVFYSLDALCSSDGYTCCRMTRRRARTPTPQPAASAAGGDVRSARQPMVRRTPSSGAVA